MSRELGPHEQHYQVTVTCIVIGDDEHEAARYIRDCVRSEMDVEEIVSAHATPVVRVPR